MNQILNPYQLDFNNTFQLSKFNDLIIDSFISETLHWKPASTGDN
uniref:Uncharacterized protein n=1 Tax=Tetranychus urticae TaxID=32264 RepID=T1JQ39_TETUR